MAKEGLKAREAKRQKLVDKYAQKRVNSAAIRGEQINWIE